MNPWLYPAAYLIVAVAVLVGYIISQGLTRSPVMPAHYFSAALWPIPALGLLWWLATAHWPRRRG